MRDEEAPTPRPLVLVVNHCCGPLAALFLDGAKNLAVRIASPRMHGKEVRPASVARTC
jgi:hypothetical protein